ncbi:MAG: AAA family ATPase [Acidimicrobiaceae bacterium]|nr:AAA family ATPase [Acidimicrobiaceae bacterium]
MAHEHDIAEEQEFLARALVALEHMRSEAAALRDSAAVATMRGAGDLVERDVVMGTALQRLDQLAIGDQPLFFGRIDYFARGSEPGETYRVGRLAVSDKDLNPLVVDWRAPVAEAFYRATGVESLGLSRRRHVAIRGHEVVSLEDEYFANEEGELDLPAETLREATAEGLVDGGLALGGPGALLAALGQARTGRMGDIVATIQGEQDRIIRHPSAGILLVQGGPGTGKTAVALHRAAYLLFTHRATLERQGVLVVGPNPLFLTYIGNVLPSLGESGVTLSTVAGLVSNLAVSQDESEEIRRLKGDLRMAQVVARAVRTRERPLARDISFALGRATIVVRPEDTRDIVERARRRPGNHNQRRSAVSRELAARLAQRYGRRFGASDAEESTVEGDVAEQIRANFEFKQIVQRVWPRLTGQDLLHDLFGSPALLRVAAKGVLTEEEMAQLARPRSSSVEDVAWTAADAALIDEARVILGPRKRPRPVIAKNPEVLDGIDLEAYSGEIRAAALREAQRLNIQRLSELDEAEFVTYGHIIVDEAQDLSPMELRVLKRRDLAGSMTIVGDMGQATTPGSAASWSTLLEILEPRREPTRVELSVSYRTPEEVLEFAAPTLAAAAVGVNPPRAVRRAGVAPEVIETSPEQLAPVVVTTVRRLVEELSPGRVAVIASADDCPEILRFLSRAGLDAVDPRIEDGRGLGADLVVVSAEGANGLEFDGVVVVEPGRIVSRGAAEGAVSPRGLRTLYVAMTRPTRRLSVIASEGLPSTLQPRR